MFADLKSTTGPPTPGAAREEKLLKIIVCLPRRRGGGGGDVRSVVPGWVQGAGPDLSVTSWACMGLHDEGCDLGPLVGRPEYTRLPPVDSDGFLIILPRKRGREQQGDAAETVEERIEVGAVLDVRDHAFLGSDAVWGSWLAQIPS